MAAPGLASDAHLRVAGGSAGVNVLRLRPEIRTQYWYLATGNLSGSVPV